MSENKTSKISKVPEEVQKLEEFFARYTPEQDAEKYGLSWAGKSDAKRASLWPTTNTLQFDAEESKDAENTKNLFIEGDNLEVLKLLQKRYSGEVKMIYIDPPYNTGKDFIYKDNFAEGKSDYLERTGQAEDGVALTTNPESNGRYHSDWLSMMYPRLFLARKLLKDDGVIFVSIDDNEVANLRLVMDEIFGEENVVANFLWKKKGTTSNVEGAQVSSLTDSTLCYRKSEMALIKPRCKLKETRVYKYNDSEGNYRLSVMEKKDSGSYKRDSMKFEIIGHKPRIGKRWQIGIDTATELEKKKRFIWDGEKVKLKIYDFEDKDTLSARPNLLLEHGTTESATLEIEGLFGIQELFDNPKPKELIRELIDISSEDNDLILDFFAGSGTTAHAVMALNAEDGGNRKCISVQIPEEIDTKHEAYKAGYKTIAEISKERIRRAGEKVKEDSKDKEGIENLDVGFKVFKLTKTNYKEWESGDFDEDEDKLLNAMKLFAENPLVEGYDESDVVYEAIVKQGFSLNASLEKKTAGFEYYDVQEGDGDTVRRMLITFAEKVEFEQVEALKLAKHDIFVCFDSALEVNTKINLLKEVRLLVV